MELLILQTLLDSNFRWNDEKTVVLRINQRTHSCLSTSGRIGIPACSLYEMRPKIHIDPDRLAAFCRKWHIRRLWLFGSVLRDDFRDDSDVDVLYEFEEGYSLGWEIVTAEDELSGILGRKADLVPEKHLKPRLRKHPMFRRELAYER